MVVAMQCDRGVTLIELLVTIALIAILAALAGPSFVEYMNETRSRYQANQFLSALNLARSEAITRVQRVTLCKAKTTSQCSTDKQVTWNDNWILFINQGSATAPEDIGVVKNTDNILKVYKGLGKGIKVGAGSDVVNFVSFSASGMPTTKDGGLISEESAYFTICGKNGTDGQFSPKARNTRIIALSKNGRINIAKFGYYPDIKTCIDNSAAASD